MLRCPLGLGWGGVGWDVNVHGTLMMVRCPLGLGWGGVTQVPWGCIGRYFVFTWVSVGC